MSPRIELDESAFEAADVTNPKGAISPSASRQLLDPEWQNPSSEILMLYVAEEPCVGLEFSYHGLNWEIVEYRNGWIARLVIGSHDSAARER